MAGLEKVSLAYSADVLPPGSWTPPSWLVGDLCLEVIMDSAIANKAGWEQLLDWYWRGRSSPLGECYRNAVVVCSLLRQMGFSADSCYVAITCHLGEDYGQATHATVLVSDKDSWALLDATKNDPALGYRAIASLREFSGHNRLVCLFNESNAFLATGDGIADLGKEGLA